MILDVNSKSLRAILMKGLLDNNLLYEELGRAGSWVVDVVKKII